MQRLRAAGIPTLRLLSRIHLQPYPSINKDFRQA